MKLSANFHLDEFLRSEVAARHGHDLEPSSSIVAEIQRLVIDVLQPARNIVDAPITIQSGFRDYWLNRKIGGSGKSVHMSGRAADINAIGYTARELANLIADSGIAFDRIILEFDSWVHIEVAEFGAEPRRKLLTAVYDEQHGTQYYKGLV